MSQALEKRQDSQESGSTTAENSKVFVGNVPFQCTTEEFQNCFKQMEGFVNADIIRRYKSKLSRGFGFVIFNNQESAEKLMKIEDMTLRDRTLRFSPYSFEKKQRNRTPGQKASYNNQIFIRNLNEEVSSEALKNHFSKYGEVSSCLVTSKHGRTYAVLSFKDPEAFQTAYLNEKEYEVFEYKKKRRPTNNRLLRDPGTIYREGFRAGHIVGYQQGYQEAMRKTGSKDDTMPPLEHSIN